MNRRLFQSYLFFPFSFITARIIPATAAAAMTTIQRVRFLSSPAGGTCKVPSANTAAGIKTAAVKIHANMVKIFFILVPPIYPYYNILKFDFLPADRLSVLSQYFQKLQSIVKILSASILFAFGNLIELSILSKPSLLDRRPYGKPDKRLIAAVNKQSMPESRCGAGQAEPAEGIFSCLLYTSDAADEL